MDGAVEEQERTLLAHAFHTVDTPGVDLEILGIDPNDL